MKILLDMQGAQCQSRHRGIGRYTQALASAFFDLAASRHDLKLAFNTQLDEFLDSLISELGDDARSHLLPLKSMRGIAARSADNLSRRQIAEHLFRHALDYQHTDVIWHSSMVEGYVDDAVIPCGRSRTSTTLGTLYDLIPLHDPEAYLGHPRVRSWYDTRIEALSHCDRLLAISEWVRQDAIERLGMPPQKIVVIGAGVDSRFSPGSFPGNPAPMGPGHGINKPFVLYNGGYDPRKNVATLIEAFAELGPELRSTHQLVLVGRVSDEQMALLMRTVRRCRLDPTSIVFTGFVPDEVLIELYRHCALFVFPSLLEGFGLPPLEAMACGAPVIGSNTASVPEVIGHPEALFDPARPSEISRRMREVLDHPWLANRLREHARHQAAKFSWEKVAERALAAIEELSPTHSPKKVVDRRRCLACLVFGQPLLWLPDLGAHYELDLIPLDNGGFSVDLQARLGQADRILYVIDRGTPPRWAELLPTWPGVVLMHGSAASGPEPHADTTTELYRSHGYHALLHASDAEAEDVGDRSPLSAEFCIGLLNDSPEASSSSAQIDGLDALPILSLPPEGRAKYCAAHIEQQYAQSPLAWQAGLLDAIATPARELSSDDLARLSDAIAFNVPGHSQQPRWLVDVTEISQRDIGTGTQRVTRSILRHWLAAPPGHVRIEPVAFVDGRYRYARAYALSLLGLIDGTLADDWVEVTPQDTFIGLDWAAESLAARKPLLRTWRQLGVRMHFIVHDLLPLSLPDAFHPHARAFFLAWLRDAAWLADALHCVSRTTAGELGEWVRAAHPAFQFERPPAIDHFFLGSDLPDMPPAEPFSATLPSELHTSLSDRPSLLMVGTIEPRKGHLQALDAMEWLWQRGVEANLVLVGRHGWLMESFMARLERHPERNRRLFWLDRVSDTQLDQLYAGCSALLAASWGEGYGLPLIEAAQHQLPILARDLPVFREVMGDYPSYFNATSPVVLAETIQTWLTGEPPTPRPRTWPGWADSATALADLIIKSESPAPVIQTTV